jgi:hypothetical protein
MTLDGKFTIEHIASIPMKSDHTGHKPDSWKMLRIEKRFLPKVIVTHRVIRIDAASIDSDIERRTPWFRRIKNDFTRHGSKRTVHREPKILNSELHRGKRPNRLVGRLTRRPAG